MNEIVEVFKPALAVVLAIVGFWHLFNIVKWLSNASGRLQMRRPRPQGEDDPSKKASIGPR